jgi:hypothetical protein
VEAHGLGGKQEEERWHSQAAWACQLQADLGVVDKTASIQV